MKLRLGMIGLGVISRFYRAALRTSEAIELVAVCDRDEAKLAEHRAAGRRVFRDWRDLLGRADLDGVIVNLPNDLHFAACADALAAGKHVCCEKPLTMSLAEADELVQLSRTAGRTLFTAFHRRYNQNVLRLREQLGDGSGVARVTARYLEKIEEHVGDDNWYLNPSRCGGGCVADNGPNVFDTLSFLLGRQEVVAARLEEVKGVDLRARVDLVGSNGMPVEVELAWDFPGECKDVTVHFHDGRRAHADMLHGFTGFKSSLDHEYVGILADFVAHVRRGEGHGEEGRDAVRLVEETYQVAGRLAHAEVS